MSEAKQPKYLYEFTVNKEIKVEKLVDEVVNEQTVKVQREVKEVQSIKFALRRPNRRMYEKADLFYGISLSEGIRAGLLTKALLLKRYRNDGGALSEADTNHFNKLMRDLAVLENEHQRYLANLDNTAKDENNKRIQDTYQKKIEVLQNLQAFENINQALFSHTAESKADVQLSNWWTIHLAYWDEKADGNYTEFFSGANFDEKMEYWDSLYEKDDSFYTEVLSRFSLLVAMWNSGVTKSEDFAAAEQQQSPPEVIKETEVKPATAETSNAGA